MKIYHNSKCSKSCAALALIQEQGVQAEVVDYLHTPLSKAELRELINLLGIKPLELIRTKEPLFQEQFAGQNLSDEEWIGVMQENPILIERPIIVSKGSALIARPVERLLKLF